ncbi:hypothetical protein EON63_25160, partial [archaeon]
GYGVSHTRTQTHTHSELYMKGLHTSRIDPSVWCSRVQDYVLYEIRCDSVWLRWAKYLKRTCGQFTTPSDRLWLKRIKGGLNLDTEYKRMYVQDLNWRLSTLNSTYALCPTYPSVLVFPGYLSEEVSDYIIYIHHAPYTKHHASYTIHHIINTPHIIVGHYPSGQSA